MTVPTVQIVATQANSILGKTNFMKLSKTILKCEQAFKEIMNISHKSMKIKLYTYVILWIVVILINWATHMYFGQRTLENKYIAANIILGYTWILNGSICTFSVMHISEIRRGFCVINECIRRMQKNNTWKHLKYEQYLKSKVWKPNVDNLAKIGLLHLDLCECIKEFNNALGLILVTKYITSFVTLLMAVYFGYITYVQSKYFFTFWCITTGFSFATSLTVLCQGCSSTVNEVKKDVWVKFCTCIILPR